jgi:mono/diheme cytochrome c family protein
MRAKLALFAVAASAIAAAAITADQATLDAARKAEQTGCVPCHSLRIVHSQRLGRAAWDRELTKMAGWGWTGKPEERAALLEYLVANYGDDKPAAPVEKSGDGRK